MAFLKIYKLFTLQQCVLIAALFCKYRRLVTNICRMLHIFGRNYRLYETSSKRFSEIFQRNGSVECQKVQNIPVAVVLNQILI